MRATILVKATFGLIHQADARWVAPQDLVSEEPSGDPQPSLDAPCETVPYLARASVTMTGTARAPNATPSTAIAARLAIYREKAVLDKTLHVFGQRNPQNPSQIQPIKSLPVRWENTCGNEDNPTGHRGPFQIVDPANRQKPAGFGAIGRTWGPRRRMLGDLDYRRLFMPLADIPEGFDWRFFNPAPADQQIDFLRGDEWIVLDGLHQEHPRLQTRLPSARGLARWHLTQDGRLGPGHDIEMKGDMLHIDAEKNLCTVVWRGVLPLDDSMKDVRVYAGVQTKTRSVTWPRAQTAIDMSGSSSPPNQAPGATNDAPPPSVGAPPKQPPVVAPAAPPLAAPAPVAPPLVAPIAAPPEGRKPAPKTAALSAFQTPAAPAAGLPFKPAAPGAAPPQAPAMAALEGEEDDDAGSTMAIDAKAAQAFLRQHATPFAVSAADARREERPSAVPATPWDGGAPASTRAPYVPPASTQVPMSSPPNTAGLPFQAAQPGAPPPRVISTPVNEESTIDPNSQTVPPGSLKVSSLPPFLRQPAAPPATPEPPPNAPSGAGVPPPPVVRPQIAEPAPAAAPPAAVSNMLDDVAPESTTLTGPKVLDESTTTAQVPVIAAQIAGSEAAAAATDGPDGAATDTEDELDGPTAATPNAAATGEAAIGDPGSETRQEVVKKLAAGEAFYDMDLANADLAGLDFSGKALNGSNLQNADLKGCTFKDSRLVGVKLAGADLTESDLTGADLTRADLKRATLDDVKLDECLLDQTDFTMAQGNGVSMKKVRGKQVNLSQSTLSKAELDSAELAGADFSGASLEACSLKNARLSEARFGDLKGQSTAFDGAELTRARFGGATLTACSFIKASAGDSNWEKASLTKCIFTETRLTKATFQRASLAGSDFSSAKLDDANLRHSNGEAVIFREANLSSADMRQARLAEVVLDGAKLEKVQGSKAELSGGSAIGADFSGASFRPARMKRINLANAIIKGADLRDADLEGANLFGLDRDSARMNGANLRDVVEKEP